MNVRVTVGLAAIALVATAPAPAAAQNADVKCLLVSNLYSKAAKEAKARQVAQAAKYFYLGRVYGRLTEAQLKAEMIALQKVITPANAGQIMNGCTRAIQTASAGVERVAQQAAPRKK